MSKIDMVFRPHRRFIRPLLTITVVALAIFAVSQFRLDVSALNGNSDRSDPSRIPSSIEQTGSNAPRSAAGSTKPGSVLFFHKFTSDIERPNDVNTLIKLTNTSPRDSVNVRIFFVYGCVVEDRIFSLVANQSRVLVASKEAPGKTGYAVAVAVNSQGLPAQFNWLIGNASLRDGRGHEAGYNAFAVAKRTAGPAPLNANARSADIIFNGIAYDRLPKTAAIDHLQNQDPVYEPSANTDIALFSPLTDLSGLTPNLYKVTATAFDFNGLAFPQELNIACGLNANAKEIWTASPFNTIIAADRHGWATFSAKGETNPLPILGLSLTDGVKDPKHSAGVMQTLEWLDSFAITVPLKLPEKPVADPVTSDQPESPGGSQGVSETKAGSVLIFPRFVSGENGKTQLFLTNTHPTQNIRLRLFYSGFVEPVEVKDSIITLGALRTTVLNPNDLAPNQRGWVMVVAIDGRALPVQFNHLIGSAQVYEAGGERASFNALAIAKNSAGAVQRNNDLETADLVFNDEVYDRLPSMTAMAFVPSQVDNSTLLGISRVAASLTEPPNTRGAVTATLYDNQSNSSGGNVPKTENRLNQIRSSQTQLPITVSLQPGDNGWLKLVSNSPIISWSLNTAIGKFADSGNGTWRGGFSGDGNLHILATAENFVVKVPANIPNNRPPVAVAETIGFQVEARRPSGTIVRLDGSASSDADPDDPLIYQWKDGDRTISNARVSDRTLGIGSHNISLVVTDVSGISGLPSDQTVTIEDTTPPQISGVPSTVNKNTDSANGDQVSFAVPVAYDMIDGAVTVTASRAPGSVFPIGKTIVTFTAQDTAGNTSTAQMEVNVIFGPSLPQTGGGAGDRAPFMDNINDQYVRAGEIRLVQLLAVDSDGDSVTFSLQGAPSYAQIISGNPGTRSATLRIGPQRGETEGRSSVRVVVNDGRGQTFITLPFRILISELPNDDSGSGAGLNRAPVAVIGNLPPVIQVTGKIGIDVTLDATKSSDQDGDKLSFTWFDADRVIARGATAKVNFAIGTHSIKLVAFDGKDGIAVAGPVIVIVLPRDLTIGSVSPARLNRPSTETLTILGTGFSSAAETLFSKEGISITNYISIEEDKIVVTISVSDRATGGFRDVYVVNPNGRSARMRSALFVNP